MGGLCPGDSRIMKRKKSVLEIFIHKVEIFCQKQEKWCPKIYLQNRKCYWKSDLIFGIYNKFSFSHVSSDFHLLVVFREKNWLENGQFSCIFWMVFGHLFAHYLTEFDETLSEQNGYTVDAKDQGPKFSAILEIFRLKISRNRPKSAKILWMIQKIFENFFFAFLESTYFNSQKKAIKFFSADFPLYDGLRLRKFFEIFRKKCFLKTKKSKNVSF